MTEFQIPEDMKHLTRNYKRNKEKITLQKFNYIFQMFENEVVKGIYHYENVTLGAVESWTFYLIAPCFLWGVKGETSCSARNLLGWRDPCTL